MRRSVALDPAHAGHLQGHDRPHGRHQAPGQDDVVVLRAAAVHELRAALDVVQRRRLPLEVVEELEELLVPAHGPDPSLCTTR